jgi:hypothetical protein
MARPVLDGFDEHYAETFWSLIPEIYRHEDGYADPPGQLRALCRILGAEAAIARRSIDRLLADSRIDEADDWALPYISQLLGTRLTSALNPAARRADIAHTIAYRRRAGTPRLLERLADDIADWDAVASEGFQRLARSWHLLDTATPRGPVTGTPRGGRVRLTSVRVSDVLDSAFDDMAHRPQIRPPDAGLGRLYEIGGVNLYVWRQYSFPLADVTPFRLDATHFTLDPSGRDVPLFQRDGLNPVPPAPRQRFEDSFDCTPKAEWSVRAPITCRRLNAAQYLLDDDPTHPPAWAPLVGRFFRDTQEITEAAQAIGGIVIADLLDAALSAESPKANLIAGAATDTPSLTLAIGTNSASPGLRPAALAGAGLGGWADAAVIAPFVLALVDPARGRVQLTAAPTGSQRLQALRLHYGVFFPVGAGSHDRRRTLPSAAVAPLLQGPTPALSPLTGNLLFADSRTYLPTTGGGGQVQVTGNARLWAADRARPYLRLSPPMGQRRIRLVAQGGARALELNGLWLGMVLLNAPAPGDLAELVLEGDWTRVTLRDLTLDPGGEQAVLPGAPAQRIAHVRLVIAGTVADLTIERCILGSLAEGSTVTGGPCSAARVRIADSIVMGYALGPAIALGTAELTLDRTTVFGDVLCRRAEISQTIIDGDLAVENAQDSSFRFSTARSGGRIPAQYESILFPNGLPAESFVSRRFGDPGLAQLSSACPTTVARGAEDGTEMGAFNRALDPIKRDDLAAKIAEYAPVQARVQILTVT